MIEERLGQLPANCLTVDKFGVARIDIAELMNEAEEVLIHRGNAEEERAFLQIRGGMAGGLEVELWIERTTLARLKKRYESS